MAHNSAGAYQFADWLVIHSNLQTDFGSFACAPFQRLDRSAPPAEIGRSLRIAIDASQTQSSLPDVKSMRKSFLAGVGVRSNAELQRSAAYVGIVQRAELEFESTHNGGTAGDGKGYQPIAHVEPLRLPLDASPEQIGATLMNAFSRCT